MMNNGMTVTESDLEPPGCFDVFFEFPFNSHFCGIGWQFLYWPATILFWIGVPVVILLVALYSIKCYNKSDMN
jgi:hypothetical protein